MAPLRHFITKAFYTKNRIYILILILFGILFVALVIRPAIIGYATYQKVKNSNYTIEDYGEDTSKLKSELLISNTNLSSCNEFSEKILFEVEKQSDKFSECRSELSAVKVNLNFSKKEYEETIKEFEEKLKASEGEINSIISEKENEANDLKVQYNLLAQNTANNICCKAKVDNPDIRYYKVEDNKIICLEEGALDITC